MSYLHEELFDALTLQGIRLSAKERYDWRDWNFVKLCPSILDAIKNSFRLTSRNDVMKLLAFVVKYKNIQEGEDIVLNELGFSFTIKGSEYKFVKYDRHGYNSTSDVPMMRNAEYIICINCYNGYGEKRERVYRIGKFIGRCCVYRDTKTNFYDEDVKTEVDYSADYVQYFKELEYVDTTEAVY